MKKQFAVLFAAVAIIGFSSTAFADTKDPAYGGGSNAKGTSYIMQHSAPTVTAMHSDRASNTASRSSSVVARAAAVQSRSGMRTIR